MPQTTAINWIIIFLGILAITTTTFAINTPFSLNNNTQLSSKPHNNHLPW